MTWLKQKAGNNSQLVQAQTANFGVSVQDVEYIFLKLFEDKFSSYSTEAFSKAKERVEEFTINFLKELNEESPESIENIKDPGVQSAVLEAESGFAKTGDENLGEILVSMLVQRTKQTERNSKQLAYNEAISVAQKLAPRHLDALTLLFFLRNVGFNQWDVDPNYLYQRIDAFTNPIISNLPVTKSDVQYLVATSCATTSTLDEVTWPYAMKKRYPGVFTKGVSLDSHPELEKYMETGRSGLLIIPYNDQQIPDHGKFQVNAVNEEMLTKKRETYGLSDAEFSELHAAMQVSPMDDDEVVALLKQRIPSAALVHEFWSETGLSHCQPTIIGTAIAHSNYRRILPAFDASIDVWIN
ncbi:LPO_1073/Vpar_1526 family protein [Streptomyces sp. H39-S7]|uniref:LPO_1073/Vpar_1526 family protein n=1 Tax=Streptomyces sp. H39-S7 TaxID=3004357 RepID=UPI0022B02B23|nr:LPO_1073/Vpar_1526 family protein [Streptomyces sp. H39-S7]MCZ4123483.1 hypothetical protein [Streptomyces sp. H39-S7]